MSDIHKICVELAEIMAHAHGTDELDILLAGLLTPQEIEEVNRRWKLLNGLLAGETQRSISERLGISLGKIARGSRLVKYGPPEFRTLVERIIEEMKESKND